MEREPEVSVVPTVAQQVRILEPVVRVDYTESNPLILKLLMALFGLNPNKK